MLAAEARGEIITAPAVNRSRFWPFLTLIDDLAETFQFGLALSPHSPVRCSYDTSFRTSIKRVGLAGPFLTRLLFRSSLEPPQIDSGSTRHRWRGILLAEAQPRSLNAEKAAFTAILSGNC